MAWVPPIHAFEEFKTPKTPSSLIQTPSFCDAAMVACEMQVIASLNTTNTFNCVIALPFGAAVNTYLIASAA